MNSRQRFGVAAALVVVSAAVSVLAAPELPARMATHWNAAGEPDGYVDEAVALALLPTMLAVLLVAFAAVPRVDPLAENIAQFRAAYDWFVVAVTGFLLLVHVGIVAYNLGYEFDVTLAVLGATALLFYGVGLLLERVERNWFVGIRTPWTLSSDEVWERTNRLGARLFKLSAVVALAGLAFGDYAVFFLLVPVLGTALGTVVYSYALYRRLNDGAPTELDADD